MFVTAKTVIRSYGRLKKIAEDLEKLITRTAVGSFSCHEPTIVQVERICSLIEAKNAVVNLKVMAKKALSAISEEDFDVLAKHYGKSKKELYLTRRTYYRRVDRALGAFEAELVKQGLTKEVFKRDYVDKISFIGVTRNIVIEEQRVLRERLKKLSINRSFRKGSYREGELTA